MNTCIIGGGISIRISQDNLLAQSFLYSPIRCTTCVHFPFHRLTLRAIGRSFFYRAHIDRPMKTKRDDHFFFFFFKLRAILSKYKIGRKDWANLNVIRGARLLMSHLSSESEELDVTPSSLPALDDLELRNSFRLAGEKESLCGKMGHGLLTK